jgi:hypothetical protein
MTLAPHTSFEQPRQFILKVLMILIVDTTHTSWCKIFTDFGLVTK